MLRNLRIQTRLGAGFSLLLLMTLASAVSGSAGLSAIVTLVAIAVAFWLAGTVSRPAGELATALKKIAAGDFNLASSLECRDELGEVASAVTALKRSLNDMADEIRQLSQGHGCGDIDVRINEEKLPGGFKEMAQGVNRLVAGHITEKNETTACIAQFGAGNLNAPLRKFPGKSGFINEAMEALRGGIKALAIDIETLSHAAADGKSEIRAEAHRHSGDFRRILEAVNDTLEAANSGGPALQVAQELRLVGSYNDVVRNQLGIVVEETEKAAFDIASRLQSIDGVVTSLTTLVDNTTAESSQLIARTEARIRDSRALVTTLDSHIQERVAALQAERQGVEQMARGARSLGRLVELIQGISLQTRLLALNASIEAAHAGEAGRGFAVVAAEVRKLSTATEAAIVQLSEGIHSVADSIETHFKNKMSLDQVDVEQKALQNVAAQLDGMGASCQEVTDHESQVLVQIQTCSQQLSQLFLAALSSVQFQDVTRQQIEHVIGALTRLDGHTDILAGRLEEQEHAQLEFTSLAQHLDEIYGSYVMSSQRESHDAALGSLTAKVAVGSPAPAIELF